MKCEHDNCLTCPYPDCISEKGPAHRVKKKPGRKKMDPEEKKRRKSAYMKEYHQKNRVKHNEESKSYYHNNIEHCKKVQKAYRERKKRELYDY